MEVFVFSQQLKKKKENNLFHFWLLFLLIKNLSIMFPCKIYSSVMGTSSLSFPSNFV